MSPAKTVGVSKCRTYFKLSQELLSKLDKTKLPGQDTHDTEPERIIENLQQQRAKDVMWIPPSLSEYQHLSDSTSQTSWENVSSSSQDKDVIS